MSRRSVRGSLAQAGVAAVPVAALLAVPLVLHSSQDRSLANTAVTYAIVASGLALMYGRLGLLVMSHAGLWGVGGYTTAILLTKHGWSLWAALGASILLAALAGAISAAPAFRLRGHHLLIAGFIVTQALAVIEQQVNFTGGAQGMLVTTRGLSLFGIDIGSERSLYYLSAMVLLVGLALAAVIDGSRLGRRFVIVRENRLLAEALGCDTRRQMVVGFALSGFYAGAGGGLFVIHLGDVEPSLFGLQAAVLLPLIVLIGGVRHRWGPVVGAFLVVFLPRVLRLNPSDAEGANGLLLIAIILLMPGGIAGVLAPAGQYLKALVARPMDGEMASVPPHPERRAP